MINPHTVKRIRELLTEKRYSMRTIAKIVGVSRGTVNAIAAGKRNVSNRHHHEKLYAFKHPSGEPERCNGCGGLVKQPCLKCQLRRIATGEC